MEKIKIVNEDFFDDEGIERHLETGTEDQIDIYRKGHGEFKFEFITRFTGINDHWRGHDKCYYPVKKVYDRICAVLDRSGLLQGDVIVSLPHVKDANDRIGEFDVSEEQMHKGEIEINGLYGYNVISDDTEFIYDIYFERMTKCPFKSFCYRLERMLKGLGQAAKILRRDKSELKLYKLDEDSGEYKPIRWSNSLYTDLTTKPNETYIEIYKECVDSERELTVDRHSHFLEDIRFDVNLDAIARKAIHKAIENCELHPRIKLLYTLNVPYLQWTRRRWNSGKPCSFIVMDLEFPEKEVDQAQIDCMVFKNMPQCFPTSYLAQATPVFVFRCPNKIVHTDFDEAKKKDEQYRPCDLKGNLGVYKEGGTLEIKDLYDENNRWGGAKIESGNYYHTSDIGGRGTSKYDQRVRYGLKCIYVLADKNGKVGKIPFANKFYRYPFNRENEQLSKFMDGRDVFDEQDYGL